MSTGKLIDEKILGLTIYNPAAELIAAGVKPIENRTWAPYGWMLGKYIAVHASTHYEQSWADYVGRNAKFQQPNPPRREECKYGVIAVARLVGWVERVDSPEPRPPRVRAMLKGYEFGNNLDELGQSIDWRWFEGPFGWVLRDVVRISPVACAGRQGLWKLPRYVYSSVKQKWLAARAAEGKR